MFTNGETREELKTMAAIQSISHDMPDLANLTLRDLFAMSALNGLLSTEWGIDESAVQIADVAYLQADAMLERRRQK
jgi:hypothetical protein